MAANTFITTFRQPKCKEQWCSVLRGIGMSMQYAEHEMKLKMWAWMIHQPAGR